MIRFTAFITCCAAFALAVPAAVSVAAPVAPSQSMRPPSATTSVLAARAKVSASLSETSFRASRAGSVKLTYSFSKRSKHFRYRLSVKNGATWQTVNRVKKTGRFKGTHTLKVKKLFAGEPVKVGSYWLKLTADAGSTTLAFTVTSEPPVTPPVVKPQAGSWHSTSPAPRVGSFLQGLGFYVSSDQSVTGLGFGYYFTGCPLNTNATGRSDMTSGYSTPITNGQFAMNPTGSWSGPVSGSLQGTFDSPTSAHGTGMMSGILWCQGPAGYNYTVNASTGTFSWTATKQ
ncbi:MAG: hypothetical protein IPG68_09120 [Micrococcales bacterium]|nr:hypothetical protein [Micrococcales bacterium]